MVAKIFAGILAVAVLGTGGYVYLHSAHEKGDCGACPTAIASQVAASCCSEESEEAPSCCQSGSRASMLDSFAKTCENPQSETFEVLAIQPREVK